jgi:hypothetical protein
VPSAAIMTDEFTSAAELMARVLGADGYPFVVIPHPMSSATHQALDTAASVAAQACVDQLTCADSPT